MPWKRPRPTSLHAKMLLAFVLMALGPVLVLSLVSATAEFGIARERSLDQLDSVVSLKAAEIDMWTSELGHNLDLLLGEREREEVVRPLLADGRSGAPAAKLRDSLLAYMRSQVEKSVVFSRACILDKDGRILVSTDASSGCRDLSGSDIYRLGLQRRYISPPFPESRGSGALVIAASRPIVETGRGAIGVIAAFSDLTVLDHIMAEPMGLGKSGESYLVGPDYLPITRLRFFTAGAPRLDHSEGVRLAVESKLSGSGTGHSYSGAAVLDAYTWLPVLHLALMVEENRSEAYGSAMGILLVGLAVVFAALLVTLAAASLVARSMAEPLEALALAASRLAAGDFRPVVEAATVGGTAGPAEEIGRLAEAFNLMAGKMSESIKALHLELAERKRAEEGLRLEHDTALQYFGNAAVLMVVLDPNGKILQLNGRGHSILGYEDGALLGRDWFDTCVPAEESAAVRGFFEGMFPAGREAAEEHENSILARSGERRIIHWHNSFLRDAEGRISGVLSSGEDVTERREYEERLRGSLAEKETLLRELYHRTKNNMGVIISLLGLKAEEFRNEALRGAFSDIQDRIRSMALVHQKLYEARDLSRIDLGDYIVELAELLVSRSPELSAKVAVVRDLQSLSVSIEAAIPCGLILNELISNALSFAFPRGRRGELRLGLRRLADEEILLEVADDGVGLPAGFDPRNDGRMGLQTVYALGEGQLNGRVSILSSGGTSCRLIFRDEGGGRSLH